MKKVCLIACLLSFNSVAHAQFFSLGEAYEQKSRTDSIGETARPNVVVNEKEEETDFVSQMKGLWMSVSMPLDRMRMTSDYGMRKHPVLGKRMAHNGIDFGVPVGSNVYAMMDGVVSRTGYDKRSGKFVVISHGEYEVCYCHLSAVLVKKGEQVKAGQVTSLSGDTGLVSGAHLHYGLKYNGKWCNPNVLLNRIKETRLLVLQKVEEHSKENA